MESGSIASWNVKVGESFGPGDSLCSVETDKATVDFEAQDDGVLAKILVEAGSGDVPVGTPILITCESADDVAAFADYQVADAAAPAAATPEPAAPAPTPTPAAAPTPPPPPPSSTPAATATRSSGDQHKIVFASPLARMLAQEMGYDISSIPGTGPGGRVVAADVKEFVPSTATAASTTAAAPSTGAAGAPAAAPIPGSGYTDYPVSANAQDVALRLMQSKRNVPHYYLTVDVAVDSLLELRASLNDSGSNLNLGVYEFLIKAAAASMKTVPSANAAWMESVVRVYDDVDINVVTGAGDTLSQPLLRNCAGKGLKAISSELEAAVAVLTDEDESETTAAPLETGMGTFTIVNLGMYGVKSCAPIIREPQACALAIGALENRIVPNTSEDSEEIYKESVVFTATLSCDHRVVDGAVGAQWLAAFKSHVENPSTLLL